MITQSRHDVKMVNYDPSCKYIASSRGASPIILTAPHGGYLGFYEIMCRQQELPSTCLLPDAMTQELLDDTVEHLCNTGISVYTVKALVHRKYCDLNRQPAEAYECPEMEMYYRDYHTTIENFIDEIVTQHGRVPVLLDLHGQGYMPVCTLRGTQNGGTCAHHRELHGDEFLTGDKSLFAHLESQDIDVDPPVGLPLTAYPLELPSFSGGYTVQRYSGFAYNDIVLEKPYVHSVSAIQLETGAYQRKDRAVTSELASKLSQAIHSFSTAFGLL